MKVTLQNPFKTYKNIHYIGPEIEGKYTTDLFVNRANALFEEHKSGDKPWFTYLSFQSVHDPIQVGKFKLMLVFKQNSNF